MKNNIIAKKESGITMIVLIVTIIVLLILSGISINMVVGDNGIIKRAQTIQKNTTTEVDTTKSKLNGLYDSITGKKN